MWDNPSFLKKKKIKRDFSSTSKRSATLAYSLTFNFSEGNVPEVESIYINVYADYLNENVHFILARFPFEYLILKWLSNQNIHRNFSIPILTKCFKFSLIDENMYISYWGSNC